jgi:hypothetical protein
MAKLTDPEKLRCYKNALSNWNYTGYVTFDKLADEWIRRELDGYSQKRFAEIMFDFVQAGGEIDQVVEGRPQWSMHSHHYDLRPTVEGQRLYVETRLIYKDPNDPDDPMIHVVNIHPA